MRRSNVATLVYLLVVFASGTVVGGFANRLYMTKTVSANPPRSRAELRKQYIQDMTGRLHLNLCFRGGLLMANFLRLSSASGTSLLALVTLMTGLPALQAQLASPTISLPTSKQLAEPVPYEQVVAMPFRSCGLPRVSI